MSPSNIEEWAYPTYVAFGAGAIVYLPGFCASLGMTNALLVTDEGLRESVLVETALDLIRADGRAVDLFADVKGNPTAANVEAGVTAFKQGEHDGVVALGGGSGLDAAKAIAFMAGQTLPIWAFEEGAEEPGAANMDALAPVIAIPTTAGTGSEVGRASVISDEAAKVKRIIFHPLMMPAVALCDPELTRGLPAHLTAATGFDAFVHCFEAFCAPGFHPMADGIALEGMRRIAMALPDAVANGDDLNARADMMAAATMGATAFQKGLGGVHALAHAVGALYDTHHGLTNAVLLPYLMEVNRDAIAGYMTILGRALDLEFPDYDGVLAWVLALRKEIGIPDDLAALGVDASRAEEIGARAVIDPTAEGNPIELSAEDYAAIFMRACGGRR